MEDKKMENDILLKTAMMGFDKKGVMDFVEKIQLENENLKRQIIALTAENEELRDAVEKLQTLHDSYNDDDQPFVTYEDLAMNSFDFEEDTMKRADLAERTIAAYTVIQEEQPDAELVGVTQDTSTGDIEGYAGEYSEYDTYPVPKTPSEVPAEEPLPVEEPLPPEKPAPAPVVKPRKAVAKVRVTRK